MLAYASHSETFRRSLVACSVTRAAVCLRTCGDIRLSASDGHLLIAARTCLRRIYSKPDRVMAPPRALTNSSGTDVVDLIDSHARKAEAVSRQSGRQRCRRP